MVGVLGVHSGASALQAYALSSSSDFLTFPVELAVPTTTAAGALVLPLR